MYVMCIDDRSGFLTVHKVYKVLEVVILDDDDEKVTVDAACFVPVNLSADALKRMEELEKDKVSDGK